MQNNEIMAIIEEIRNTTGSETANRLRFKKRYPDFADKFPKLFDAAINKQFPLTYLKFMLEEKERLESNQQSVDEADKTVYDKLREDFINPVISNKAE